MSLCRGLNRLYFHFNNLNISQSKQCTLLINRLPSYLGSLAPLRCDRSIHTTGTSHDLMEFFDHKDNWGMREVYVGRSWRKDELRLKSNSDLHKLWYVLLKERNMLLTMKHEYDEKFESFPNPERIDKVEESMENLETVVRERNRAYFQLEVGTDGERPRGTDKNCFGLTYDYRMAEHLVEKQYNTTFKNYEKLHKKTSDHEYISKFLIKLQEKQRKKDLSKLMKQFKMVCNILKHFPNVDEEALKERFPFVDIEEAKRSPLSRGHRENKY